MRSHDAPAPPARVCVSMELNYDLRSADNKHDATLCDMRHTHQLCIENEYIYKTHFRMYFWILAAETGIQILYKNYSNIY